ncbi:MAG: hypothetical protein ABI208_02625 [Ginsengibacter sp.]
MKTTKMSLTNIQGKLSRAEMKNIMAGSGSCTVMNGPPCSPGTCPNVCYVISLGVICCG